MSELFLTNVLSTTIGLKADQPVPTAPESLYLIGLLEVQNGLKVAKMALSARAALADADETRQISIQLGLLQSDYIKIDTMITAFLSSSTIFLPISSNGLAKIRYIVEQLEALVADRDRVTDIVLLVTQLLSEWDTKKTTVDAGKDGGVI